MDFDSYERELWAGRAPAYERGFARLTAHAAGPLLDAAGAGPDTRVLDVGTGPGVVAVLPDLPLPGGEFDAVTGNFVIHATGDPAGSIPGNGGGRSTGRGSAPAAW